MKPAARTGGLVTGAALLWLCACAMYSEVPPGRRAINEFYSVESPIAWSGTAFGEHSEYWTVDGLEGMILTKGIPDGEPVAEFVGGPSPLFRKKMSGLQVMEFVKATFVRLGSSSVETRDLAAAPFGSQPGSRFYFEFIDADRVQYDGLVNFSVVDDKLYLIAYFAPRDYYYAKYVAAAEQLIASVVTR